MSCRPDTLHDAKGAVSNYSYAPLMNEEVYVEGHNTEEYDEINEIGFQGHRQSAQHFQY